MGRGACLLGTLLLCSGLIACQGDKGAGAAGSASASGTQTKPPVDSRIASAVESAAKPQGSGAADDGPPPNGVFPPGEADRAVPPGSPRKLELLDKGSEPRAVLRPATGATWPKSIDITVAQRLGPQAMPTLDYSLAFKAGGDGAKADGKKADDQAEPAVPAAQQLTIAIKKVSLSRAQPGSVPREVEKEIAKLEGTKITGQLGADGAPGALQVTLPKGADPTLRPVLDSLLTAIDYLLVPVPAEAVGAGAYWMVADRAKPIGLDVVRYRVYRVKELSGQTATLSAEVRQYSVGGPVQLGAAAGNDVTPSGFESAGQAALTMAVGAAVPATLEIGLPLRMQLGGANKAGQAMMLQADFAARAGKPAPPAEP